MDIKIETATIKLLDKLYEIEKQSFQREAFTKQEIGYLLADYNAISLVARVNNEVVGFAMGRMGVVKGTSCGHIVTLETLPSYRRRGVALKLLREIESLFREKGAVESHLEVREENTAAIGLYIKLGYQLIGKLERYYDDAHGLYLKKNLVSSQG